MKHYTLCVLLAAAAVACTSRELDVTTPRYGKKVIAASLESGGSKTALVDGSHVVWSENDAIAVFGPEGQGPYEFKIVKESIDPETGSAKFEGDMPDYEEYSAIYPYNSAFTFDGSDYVFTAPESASVKKDGVAENANIAVALPTASALAFKNVGTLMKITLKMSAATSITLSTGDPAYDFSGTYKLAASSFTLSQTARSGKGLTLSSGGKALEAGVYYIPVPHSATAIQDLTVSVKDGSGNVLSTKTYTSNVRLLRNKVCNAGNYGTGIATPEDLAAFRDAVNSGASIAPFTSDGKADSPVVLLSNIDCSGLGTWVPIGNASVKAPYNAGVTIQSGYAFTGTFDGQVHCIYNIKLQNEAISTGSYGLFGYVNGGTVKNLTMGQDDGDGSIFKVKGSVAAASAGVIAGVMYNSTIENCTNYIPMVSNGSAYEKGRYDCGMVGYANSCTVRNLTNYASAVTEQGANAGIGSDQTCVNFGCIVGYALALDSAPRTTITDCLNYGDITSTCSTSSGIVARAYLHTTIDKCENYGNQIHDTSANSKIEGRIGNIIGFISTDILFTNNKNYGDLTLKATATKGGGLAGNTGNKSSYDIIGCANYGKITVATTNVGSTTYSDNRAGLLIGYLNGPSSGSKVVMKNCVAGGSLWNWNGGNPTQYNVTDANLLCYIGGKKSTVNVEGITRKEIEPEVKKRSVTGVWRFGEASITSEWESKGTLPTYNGTAATISVQRGQGTEAFRYTTSSNSPVIGGMAEGDYILFTTPLDKALPAGTSIQINSVMANVSSKAPVYYLVEVYDDGQWRSVADETYPVPENNSLRYSFRMFSQTGQLCDVFQIYTLTAEVVDTLLVRYRVIGSYAVDGSELKSSAIDNKIKFSAFPQGGAYITSLGGTAAASSKKLLCLGNSFSYYYAPAWYLQELAFREGMRLELCGHFKGSQTFGNHLSLEYSTEAINKGNFDFAFLQDQSQNPAKYASDQTTYASVMTNCESLVKKVKDKSSSVQTIIENTWSFSSGSYGGFSSYDNFDKLLDEGTTAMASKTSSITSPIGQAFAYARKNYPSINLYHTDSKHQGQNGAYLKACVNCLVITGKTSFTGTNLDCGLDSAVATNLRTAAEEAVKAWKK